MTESTFSIFDRPVQPVTKGCEFLEGGVKQDADKEEESKKENDEDNKTIRLIVNYTFSMMRIQKLKSVVKVLFM